MKRIFVIVLDSFGIGALPDASAYGDAGSNTFGALIRSGGLHIPCLTNLGIFSIDGENQRRSDRLPLAAYGRMAERSQGKDTTTGHWEIAGIVSETPFPTYPKGFPPEVLEAFERATGRKVLCNRPYSGTAVIADYGEQHMESGALIVYTSADSVFQIAAHEDVVPVEILYEYCHAAREILTGAHAVGRVIARPFTGNASNFVRTSRRRDFSLSPTGRTMLDVLSENGRDVIAVGKIKDIFAGRGITDSIKTTSNDQGMCETIGLLNRAFTGLAFVNLVDFDMLYGHRNDVKGYTNAINRFDAQLSILLSGMRNDDILMITADHGCDPSTASTDHSREYVPLLVYGQQVSGGINLGTRASFADLGATVLQLMNLPVAIEGQGFYSRLGCKL